MCHIVSNVAFAYGGVELFGLAAVETASPKNQSIVPENKFLSTHGVLYFVHCYD